MLETSGLKILLIKRDNSFSNLSEGLAGYGYDVDISENFPEPDKINQEAVLIDGGCEGAVNFINRLSGEKKNDSKVVFLFSDRCEEYDRVDRIDEIIPEKTDHTILNEKIKYRIRIKNLENQLADNEKSLKIVQRDKDYYEGEYLSLKDESSENHDFLHNSLKQIALMVKDKEALEVELEKSDRIYKKNFNNFINLLSSLIEGKRQYHKGHSKKVAEISVYIAKSLELDEKETDDIEIASLLHEIGKLSIPDELSLKNPEEYSKSERDLLAQHPVAGAYMLEEFSGFEGVSKIIRHIHEHVDGTGFPDGLRRSKIPYGSRIISAANIYDNLVYRSNYSVPRAFSIIEELIGIRYDSRVVNHLHKYANQNAIMDKDRSNEINIYEIRPGMTLASGIFTPLGAKLLPVGYVLTQKDIDKISSYHKLTPLDETVYIKD